jgi:N-dimethylarginine dimethylaminohydrolase
MLKMTQNDTFSLKNRNLNGKTSELKRWGVDSETGTLRDVLVGPIDNLTRILPTNSINKKMIREGVALDVEGAKAQYNDVLECFREAEVNIHITPPDTDLPLQIWARDGSFMSPWGMIIAQMNQWWRRGEYGPVIDFCNQESLPIYDKVTAGCYEGGDVIIVKPGHVLLGYSDERSQEVGALQVKKWFEQEGWEVMLMPIDPYFVHADVLVAMLTNNLAAVCVDAVDANIVLWLQSLGFDIIDVPFKYVGSLGVNVLSLGKERVLIPKQSEFLIAQSKAHGLKVYAPDVSKITICGGGIHCMTQPLKRDPF